jgi:hypothetical protein
VIRHLSLAALVVLACARADAAQQPVDDCAAAIVGAPAPTTAQSDATIDAANTRKGKSDRDKSNDDETSADKKKAEPADPKTRSDGGATTSAAGDTATSADETAAQAVKEKDDAVLNRAQPDFTIVNLQTSLRLPKYKSAFRVTHRFTRPLGQGDFGDLLEDFFGFDSAALIGLEYRFGLMPGLQVGILRTSDKTIQFFSQYEVKGQSESFPIGLAALAMIDGTNNFRDSYSPALGAIVSRTFGTRAALYLEPIWVNNSNPDPSEIIEHNDTFLLGVGGRLRIGGGTYIVGEFIPRVAGYDPGTHGGSFGIEKRVGGHAFQMNFSNTFGTTIGQIARGGISNDDWYIGFNITRKFY